MNVIVEASRIQSDTQFNMMLMENKRRDEENKRRDEERRDDNKLRDEAMLRREDIMREESIRRDDQFRALILMLHQKKMTETKNQIRAIKSLI